MIELTFNGSTSGMLYHNAGELDTPGINWDEIITLDLMMDLGQLDRGIDSDERLAYADNLYLTGYPDCTSEDTPEDVLEAIKEPDDFVPGGENRKEMKKFRKLLSKGKDVRIWYDIAPGTLCCYYAMCAFLRDFKNKVFVMEAPRYIKSDGDSWIAQGWGTFNGEDVGPLLHLTRKLRRAEKEAYAKHWDKLVKENAPLRTVLGSVPISVSEDFYDRFLYEFIPDEPFKVSKLQWDISRRYPTGFNTVWYSRRLWEKIQQGEFKIVSKDIYYEDMVIQKC